MSPSLQTKAVAQLKCVRCADNGQAKVVAQGSESGHVESRETKCNGRHMEPVHIPQLANIHLVILGKKITGKPVVTEAQRIRCAASNVLQVLNSGILNMVPDIIPKSRNSGRAAQVGLKEINPTKAVSEIQGTRGREMMV